MKIAFNIDYFFNRNTGIGRYGVELMKSWIALGHPCQIWMTKFMKKFQPISSEISERTVFYPWPRRITDHFWPGKHAEETGITWVHSANSRLLPRSGKFKQACMIHDLGPFKYGHMKTGKDTDIWTKRIRMVVKRADCILVNSPSTLSDLIELFPCAENKSFITPLGIDHFSPEKRAGEHHRHILNVGTVEPRKNIDGLLRAYSLLNSSGNMPPLVIAGMDGFKADTCKKLADSLKIADKVRFTGFVSDTELKELYSKALCLVHPAHHEGFGFTIPEAFAWGLPVAASVNGGAGDFFRSCVWPVDPSNPESIAMGILQALEHGVPSAQITARKQAREELTWQNCAEKTVAALKMIDSVRN